MCLTIHIEGDFLKVGRFEVIIAVALALIVLCGTWCEVEFDKLSEQVIRLHVIANSDSEGDQQLKLRVRDAVLETAQELTGQAETPEAARELLKQKLDEIDAAAQQVIAAEGYSYEVKSKIDTEHYDTRVYEDFSLPEGDYTSLQVTIGTGEGKNWWCVVFPPLCTGAVTEHEEVAAFALDDGSTALITKNTDGYVIKFKAIELLNKLKKYFGW